MKKQLIITAVILSFLTLSPLFGQAIDPPGGGAPITGAGEKVDNGFSVTYCPEVATSVCGYRSMGTNLIGQHAVDTYEDFRTGEWLYWGDGHTFYRYDPEQINQSAIRTKVSKTILLTWDSDEQTNSKASEITVLSED